MHTSSTVDSSGGRTMHPTVRTIVNLVAVVAAAVALLLGQTADEAGTSPRGEPSATASHEYRPAASVRFGEIPETVIRNQFIYCSLICPYLLQGVTTVPIAVASAPGVFVSAYASTGSIPTSMGMAAHSVTRPAHSAMTGIIVNDLTLVLPRAQNALTVAVVEGLNVAAVATSPDESNPLLAAGQAFDTGRVRIRDALNAPVTPNPESTAIATTEQQIAAVDSINAASAVLFWAPELLLLGATETADAAAAELATTGDVDAARSVGETHAADWLGRAESVIREATD